ncbi:MAG: DUF2796 domain-containing protein [Burkholderiaceae bacterium]
MTLATRRLCAPTVIALSSFALLLATEVRAQTPGTHEHGRARLNIAVDGAELTIELEVPAVHVAGRESAPPDAEARRLLRTGLDRLAEPGSMFMPSAAAGCHLERIGGGLHGMALVGESGAPGDDTGKRGAAHRSEHAHEHEHGRAAATGDRDHARDEHESQHADLLATYEWHCDRPDALTDIDVRLFDRLNGLRSLTVRLITERIQRESTWMADGSLRLHP